MRAGVVIPVGPGELELERLADTVESLRAHVPDLDLLVLVDDGDEPRGLEHGAGWDESRLVALRPPRGVRSSHMHDRMAAGTLTFLSWLATHDRVDYLVKLDTDALLIGDFRPSLEAAIGDRPDVGVWGAYRENVDGGEQRDFSMFALPLRLARLPLRLRRSGELPLSIEQAVTGPAARSRRFVRAAVAAAERNGYESGEHCLGGSYAVTRAAARRMRERGWLRDAHATHRTHLAEDVVLGLLARASGLELASLVAPGEAFAVKFRGLLAEPDELISRGHAIVHSVKDDGRRSESETRALFRAAR
jgi:hypothetical protein